MRGLGRHNVTVLVVLAEVWRVTQVGAIIISYEPSGIMMSVTRSAATRAPRVRLGAKTGSDAWWRPVLRRERSIAVLYALPTLERMQLVRDGVPATLLGVLATAMGVTKETLYSMLQLPRATVNRKVRSGERLGPPESERVIGLVRLIGEVQTIVEESGDPVGFDAPRWVASWLDHPLPALGGERPATYMDTADGRDLISGLVAQMQSGAYA